MSAPTSIINPREASATLPPPTLPPTGTGNPDTGDTALRTYRFLLTHSFVYATLVSVLHRTWHSLETKGDFIKYSCRVLTLPGFVLAAGLTVIEGAVRISLATIASLFTCASSDRLAGGRATSAVLKICLRAAKLHIAAFALPAPAHRPTPPAPPAPEDSARREPPQDPYQILDGRVVDTPPVEAPSTAAGSSPATANTASSETPEVAADIAAIQAQVAPILREMQVAEAILHNILITINAENTTLEEKLALLREVQELRANLNRSATTAVQRLLQRDEGLIPQLREINAQGVAPSLVDCLRNLQQAMQRVMDRTVELRARMAPLREAAIGTMRSITTTAAPDNLSLQEYLDFLRARVQPVTEAVAVLNATGALGVVVAGEPEDTVLATWVRLLPEIEVAIAQRQAQLAAVVAARRADPEYVAQPPARASEERTAADTSREPIPPPPFTAATSAQTPVGGAEIATRTPPPITTSDRSQRAAAAAAAAERRRDEAATLPEILGITPQPTLPSTRGPTPPPIALQNSRQRAAAEATVEEANNQ